MLKKGIVAITADGETEPLAQGQCYFAWRSAPSGRVQAGGTITRLVWTAPGAEERAGPGAYRLLFDDGGAATVAITAHLYTACGPQVLRFTADGPPQ